MAAAFDFSADDGALALAARTACRIIGSLHTNFVTQDAAGIAMATQVYMCDIVSLILLPLMLPLTSPLNYPARSSNSKVCWRAVTTATRCCSQVEQ
jgi:hypothetical protein